MHKLMVLFRKPPDVTDFEARWSHDFVPRAEKMPGLRRVAVSRVYGGPAEEVNLYLVHEFFFDNAEGLRRAMASAEGQAAGRALMAFAAGYVTLCFADHLEEDRRKHPGTM